MIAGAGTMNVKDMHSAMMFTVSRKFDADVYLSQRKLEKVIYKYTISISQKQLVFSIKPMRSFSFLQIQLSRLVEGTVRYVIFNAKWKAIKKNNIAKTEPRK